MPNTDFDLPTDADDDQSDSEGMKSLRTALRKSQKEANELRADRDKLAGRVKSVDIQEAFTAAGLNPKLAKFYDGELSKDAVASWAADNADVFGITRSESSDSDPDPSDSTPAPLTPEQQVAARVAGASAQGGSPESKDLLAQLEGLMNDPDGYAKALSLGLIQSAY